MTDLGIRDFISWLFGKGPGSEMVPPGGNPLSTVNVARRHDIGPFHLPDPEDPRWSAVKTERGIIYRLDVVECRTLRGGALGIISVDGDWIKDSEEGDENFSRDEDCYVLEVQEAYKKSHPGFDAKSLLRDKIIARLSSIPRP